MSEPSTDPPSDERPVSRAEYERMRRVADEQHAKLTAALLEIESLRAVPSLPVPDPPDDVRNEVSDVLHEALGIGDDQDDERDFLNDTTQAVFDAIARCGAVVVFGDGLPMGARLAPVVAWLDDRGVDHRWEHDDTQVCGTALYGVLTDKEPQT